MRFWVVANVVCRETQYRLVFMPSLLRRFREAQDHSQAPLTAPQARAIRAEAVGVRVTLEIASKMEQRRGFKDLDQDNFWAEWQQLQHP